jgi:NMD protein affecting ribosome stability and mRNA decay
MTLRQWYGRCAECGRTADLAYRPGTIIKVCVRCMYPDDHVEPAGARS